MEPPDPTAPPVPALMDGWTPRAGTRGPLSLLFPGLEHTDVLEIPGFVWLGRGTGTRGKDLK